MSPFEMIVSIINWFTSWFVVTQVSPQSSAQARRRSVSALLKQYEHPGRAPATARVDPRSLQRDSPTISLRHAWRLSKFLTLKAAEVVRDFISHHLWGPRKKSWGIEMTLITSMLRNAGAHSHLADVNRLRSLMHIAGWAPVPSDALVTPVTFRVVKRCLRGFLASADSREAGERMLQGEWVVGKKLWQRLRNDFRVRQSSARNEKRREGSPTHSRERIILYLHGGAYYVFSAATHRVITIPLSKYTDSRVFALNYRLAPETRFPGPLHDAVLGYLRLVEDLHIPPQNIVVAGDSAGGGLALALLMYLRDNAYPLPAGAILMSPWVDLTMSCDSWDSNAPFDVVPFPPHPSSTETDHLHPVACYLGPEGMAKYLTHPYASPLFGDFTRLPPLLIQSGEAEVLRDEVMLLAHKARCTGVEVRHEMYEDAVHVFQIFPFLESSQRAFSSFRTFIYSILPLNQVMEPTPLNLSVESKLETETGNLRSRLVSGVGEPEPEQPLEAMQTGGTDGQLKSADSALTPVGDDYATVQSTRPSSPSVSIEVPHTPEANSLDDDLDTFVPAPSSRLRVKSHPDIQALCREWADNYGESGSTVYRLVAQTAKE